MSKYINNSVIKKITKFDYCGSTNSRNGEQRARLHNSYFIGSIK